jgi:NitT/TauT family transport system substrate-binding protein
MKRFAPAAVYFSSVLFLFLLTVTEAQKSASTPQVLRVICLPARPLALTVAHDRGLLSKYAIEVQGQVATNSDELRTGLAEGKFDLAHAAVDNAVAMIEKSGADVIVVMGGEGSTNELLAQPDIHSVEDLRGHTVIVDAPNTAYAIQLKKILLLHGLEPDRDYQIKPIGATPARLAAMREHKEYAASLLGPPTSLLAKRQGFLSLGATQQILGPYQGSGAFARKSWTNENGVWLTRYIVAFIEAQRWILDPANKAQVVALLAREFKLPDDLASEAYTSWIAAPGGFEPDAAIDLAGFRNVLELRAEIEHTWKGHAPGPEKYYDPAYYNAALSRLPAR